VSRGRKRNAPLDAGVFWTGAAWVAVDKRDSEEIAAVDTPGLAGKFRVADLARQLGYRPVDVNGEEIR
jgi:hypothetical protein